jgi:hypothetical protein
MIVKRSSRSMDPRAEVPAPELVTVLRELERKYPDATSRELRHRLASGVSRRDFARAWHGLHDTPAATDRSRAGPSQPRPQHDAGRSTTGGASALERREAQPRCSRV